MFARIRARAPLVLASLLFGAGVAGLLFSTNTGPEWGPFQPRNSSSPQQRVILVQVGPEITPPPLHELFAGEPAFEQHVAAQVQELPEVPPAATPPEPTTPLQQHDAAVSAAAATATPPPPLLIPGLAIDGSDETPAPESTPAGE